MIEKKQKKLGKLVASIARSLWLFKVIGLSALITLASVSPASELYQPDEEFDLDIPEMNAAEALNLLAEQTDSILLFDYQEA